MQKKAEEKKPSDPRHRSLLTSLLAAFRAARGVDYACNGRDASAVTQLLAISGGDTVEVMRRFRLGLGESYGRHVDTLPELVARWNKLAVGTVQANIASLPLEPTGLPAGVGSPGLGEYIASLEAEGKLAEAERLKKMRES